VLFWTVAHKAAQVEPLRKKVSELENSSTELADLGQQITKLRSFEQQVRRVLAGRELANESPALSWPDSSTAFVSGASEFEPGRPFTGNPVGEARSLRSSNYTPMDVPNSPPVRGYITRSFYTAQAPRLTAHHGVDIAAKEGTPVLAAGDGLVLFADWTYRYGNLVLISHRSGFVSFYGHNETMFVRAGERVKQGEPVALVGSSGQSTAPHLHFEIWADGTPVDPVKLMQSIP
jgi:murein DD-endopeptidase MepM/ murein hydrolase activator NlpD